MLFKKAIIYLMRFTNWFNNRNSISKESAEKLVLLMSPFTPHISEELWEYLGNKPFCSLQKWPECDEKKIDAKLEAAEQVIHNTISDINNVLRLIKVDKPTKIILIISPKWKYKFIEIFKKEIEKTRDIKALIQTLMKEKDLKPY